MIKIIFTAFGLDSFYQAHSKELGVIALVDENRSGEYKREIL